MKPAATFGGLAEQVFSSLAVNLQIPGSRVDFVIDRYLQQSIKLCERQQRAARGQGTIRVNVLSCTQKS